MAIFSHHFHQLQMEMRAQGIYSQIRPFVGEGSRKFSEWVRDMERAKVTLQADDSRMQVLALQTLGGQAAEFCARILKDGQVLAWDTLKSKLKSRYSDLADTQYARQSLRHLRQKKGETVQNFYDRLLAVAEEAFSDLDLDAEVIQQQLVEIFVDGLVSDSMARKLISNRPRDVERALKAAIEEQQANRSFQLRRGRGQEHEPMEVDMVQTDGLNSLERFTSIEKSLKSLKNQIDTLVRQGSQANVRTNPERGPRPQTYAQVTQRGLNQPTSQGQFDPRPNRQSSQQGPPRSGNNHRSPNNNRSMQNASRPLPRWTEDGRPICLRCNAPGHMGHECRNRMQGRPGQSLN